MYSCCRGPVECAVFPQIRERGGERERERERERGRGKGREREIETGSFVAMLSIVEFLFVVLR